MTEKYMPIPKENINTLFQRLLKSQCFAWDNEMNKTVEEKINETASSNAKETLTDLFLRNNGSVADVVTKISGRAATWGYQGYLDKYRDTDVDLDLFVQSLIENQDRFRKQIDSQEEQNPELIASKWIVDTLLIETRKLNNRKKKAENELEKIRQRILYDKQRKLKNDPTGDKYIDSYNKEVCLEADKLNISLPEATRIIDQRLLSGIFEQDFLEKLTEEYKSSRFKSLENLLAEFLKNGFSPDKAIKICCILFEIDLLKTEEVWGNKKFTEILTKGLEGEQVNLITMLCLINKFDYKGGYTSEPDIFAYKQNPKLEAVPLIINEMVLLPKFFAFYNIDTSLTIYIADTDYTEIGEFGPVNDSNVENIRKYISNVKDYLRGFANVKVIPISDITSKSEQYQEVKARVLKNVKDFKDVDFSREWYQKFENDLERRFESQTKRKLFPEDQIRARTLELTRNIWACNAAQGTVFGTLGKNTILVSTERRERDQNYTIDKSSQENFPPVIYVLKAAEEWNRKITTRKTV